MCGRFTIRTSGQAVAEHFGLPQAPELFPRYNVAPTQNVPAVRLVDGQRVLSMLRWGLIPSWAKDAAIGARLINARADTVADKPSFRSAFKRRRCLVVADGFYEWKANVKQKQPYFIRLRTDAPFAFAGLWEHWQQEGQPVETCTIITTEPNPLMAELHDRMPVILPATAYAAWLDPDFQGRDELLGMLRPYPADEMTASPVSTHVNNPRHEDAGCLEPG